MIGILRSAFILIAAIAIIGGGTYSYFSTTDSAPGTLATGELSINLLNQNAVTDFSFKVTDLLPGGTALVNFDLKNDSTTGIQLRGAAFGEWASVASPNNALVGVVRVERWDGSSWVTIAGDGTTPLTGIFYDSPTGTDTVDNFVIPAGGKDQFQLTVKLDSSTGDKYQGETYNASVKVQARQYGATAWPADLNTGF
ncbi:MAG: TasA family protein [Candidatus Moraniibacteriota bacterium]